MFCLSGCKWTKIICCLWWFSFKKTKNKTHFSPQAWGTHSVRNGSQGFNMFKITINFKTPRPDSSPNLTTTCCNKPKGNNKYKSGCLAASVTHQALMSLIFSVLFFSPQLDMPRQNLSITVSPPFLSSVCSCLPCSHYHLTVMSDSMLRCARRCTRTRTH